MAKQASKKGVNKFYLGLGVVALAGGGWIAYTALRGPNAQPGSAPPPLALEQATLQGGYELGVAKGDPGAPVVIQEFADYQCPACGQFSSLTARGLDEQYVRTGKVYWIFFDFPIQHIHRNALPAAQAARCAGEQGNYWGMHDILFARQPEWSKEGNPIGRFKEYGKALGLDPRALERCLESGTYRTVVLQSYERGVRLGVDATPTFFVGRQRLQGAHPYETFAQVIETTLASQPAGR